jgi:hypothetical protein
MQRMNHVGKNLALIFTVLILVKPDLTNAQNKTGRADRIQSNSKVYIDGTYELTERVMSDGTVLRAPAIKGLYMLFHGRLNFNLFIKKRMEPCRQSQPSDIILSPKINIANGLTTP